MATLFVKVVMTGALYLQLQDPATFSKIRHLHMCGGNQDSGAQSAGQSLYFLTYHYPGNSDTSTKTITTTTTTKTTTNTPITRGTTDFNTPQSTTRTSQPGGPGTTDPSRQGSPTSTEEADSTEGNTLTTSSDAFSQASITSSNRGKTVSDVINGLRRRESEINRRRRRQAEHQHGRPSNTRKSSDSPTVPRRKIQVQRKERSQAQGGHAEKHFDPLTSPTIKILQQRHEAQPIREESFDSLTTLRSHIQHKEQKEPLFGRKNLDILTYPSSQIQLDLGQLVTGKDLDSVTTSGHERHLQEQDKRYVRGKRSDPLTIPNNSRSPGKRNTKKSDSDNRGDAACSCIIEASSNVAIFLLNIWSASAPDGAMLNVDFVNWPNASIRVNLSDLRNNKNETLQRTIRENKIRFHVTNQPGTIPYTLSLAVHGNISLNCGGSDYTGTPFSRMPTLGQDNRANTEATEKAGREGLVTLIVGVILAAVGLLLLVIGALVWQRYAAEHKKKQTECIEMNAFPNDQYEDVNVSPSDDPAGDKQVIVIEKDPPSKASLASLTSSHSKQADNVPPTSPSPDPDHASDSSTKDKKQNHSPDKPKPTRFSFFRRKKSKKDKNKERKEDRERSCYVSSQDDGEQHYSVVEQEDYEEITEVYQKSLQNKKNIKMATPLMSDVEVKAGLASLKKVEINKTEAQKWAATMPKMPLPGSSKFSQDVVKEEQEEYSHLDHSGRAVSFDLTQMDTYDGFTPRSPGGDAVKSKTAEVPNTKSNVFKFSRQSSNADTGVTTPDKNKESAEANKENNTGDEEEDEGEHIYEAYESPVAASDNSRPNLADLAPVPNLPPTTSDQTPPSDSAVQAAAKPQGPKSEIEPTPTPADEEKDAHAADVPKPKTRHSYDEIKTVDKFPEIIELHVTPKSEDKTKQSDQEDASTSPDTSSEDKTDKDDSVAEEPSEKRQSNVGEPVVDSGIDEQVTEELSPDPHTDKKEDPTPATEGQVSNDTSSSSEEQGANSEKDNDSSKEDASIISEPQCEQTEATSCQADDTASQNNDIETENQKSESPHSENDEDGKTEPPSNDNLKTSQVDVQSVEESQPAPDVLADLPKEPTDEQEEFVIVDNVLYQPLAFTGSDTKIDVKL